MLIDFEQAKKDLADQEVEQRLEAYSVKLRAMLVSVDEILDDMELSEIDWFKVKREQKEKIEAISTLGLMMEVYAGWAKE